MHKFSQWRKICLNFPDSVKWLVSEVIIAPHRIVGEVKKDDECCYTVKALWDTGSTTTIICPEIAKALKLKDHGKELMTTVVGHGEVSTYYIDMILMKDIVFQKVKVVEMDCRNSHFDMIIGIDLIKLGKFTIQNEGNSFTMNFEVPIKQRVKLKDE